VAKVSWSMPEDFLLKVSKLRDRTDEILPKVLEVGAQVVEAKVRSNLLSVIGKEIQQKSRSTGQLVESLGVSQALQDREGNFNIKVGFSEPRKDGESNAMIASIIEYGKSGQPAKPFMKPAKSASKTAAINAMKEKLDEEMKRL